jgi:hypothetical protein
MATFVLCDLPGGGEVFVNLERVTFVRANDSTSSLIGFDEDINTGLLVAELPNEVLAGQTVTVVR